MALTFTQAGLQSALDSLNTAVAAYEAAPSATLWASGRAAFVAYELTYAGLIRKANADGVAIELPDPAGLSCAKTFSEDSRPAELYPDTADTRRLIRVFTRHSR